MTYRHAPTTSPGELDVVSPLTHDVIYKEKADREVAMRHKNFFTNEPPQFVSITRTVHGPLPKCNATTDPAHPTAQELNQTNLFTSKRDCDMWNRMCNSTQRVEFVSHPNHTVQLLKKESALCRAQQQKTSFILGDTRHDWVSESRRSYTGAPCSSSQPQSISGKSLLSTVELSTGASPTEVFKSLKQVDYLPHIPPPAGGNSRIAFDARADTVVLGHQKEGRVESLYRSSFTPMRFLSNS